MIRHNATVDINITLYKWLTLVIIIFNSFIPNILTIFPAESALRIIFFFSPHPFFFFFRVWFCFSVVNINQTLPVRQAAKNRPTSSYHRGVSLPRRPPRGEAAALPTPVQVQVNTYNPHNPEKNCNSSMYQISVSLAKVFWSVYGFLMFFFFFFKALFCWLHRWFALIFFFFFETVEVRGAFGVFFGGVLFSFVFFLSHLLGFCF